MMRAIVLEITKTSTYLLLLLCSAKNTSTNFIEYSLGVLRFFCFVFYSCNIYVTFYSFLRAPAVAPEPEPELLHFGRGNQFAGTA